MVLVVTHATVASDPQDPLLGADDWNADHIVVGLNTIVAQVDFGFQSGQEGNIATVTVEAPWVTPSSVIICAPFASATDDHDPEDYALEGIKAYATNIVDGVSFDIIASANDTTFGKYNIQAIGV